MSIKILTGDCRDVLRTLPAESVHCVVTSPPYWGLRDYGTATWDGGDPACDHVIGDYAETGRGLAALGERCAGGGHKAAEPKPMTAKRECPHCGARRIDSQIGLETTYQEFVEQMVAVFREVRRVLRKDGTLWLNLGDSYVGGGRGGHGGLLDRTDSSGVPPQGVGNQYIRSVMPGGLKPKDLCGIPWRVAFALQADGWYLRQDIIWSKPNPMPESVTDRCTKAHEYLFLLSKSGRYYYDAEAIKEDGITNDPRRPYGSPGANALDPRQRQGEGKPRASGVQHKQIALGQQQGGVLGSNDPFSKRNRRSVWEVATQPFSEAHFATFPPALIEPCILAGCPKGGTVLDPFGGAGTTGLVADRLQRSAILIELNPAYADMARKRIIGDAPLFVAAE